MYGIGQTKRVLRFWSQFGLKIGAVTYLLLFLEVICFLPTSEIMWYFCISGYWNQSKFPIHKVWWLREASEIGQTFIPLCEQKSFKTQRGRIPIHPAILVAVGHRFIIKKLQNKNADARSFDQEPETFLALLYFVSDVWSFAWCGYIGSNYY